MCNTRVWTLATSVLSSEIYYGFHPVPAIELLTVMIFRGGSIKIKKRKR
jgi:hypothetical protein